MPESWNSFLPTDRVAADMDTSAYSMQQTEKLKVFISYSRKDLEFVDRLQVALSDRGITAYVDREDIEKGEEWWTRIQQLITDADTIIFVLSPSSVVSRVCQDEVDYAEDYNKRFIPVVAESVAGYDVPDALARLNYIFFIPVSKVGISGNFDQAVDQLARALETDIRWIREHTRLGALSQRWEKRRQANELVLRGAELSAAETWLTNRPKNAPNPTDAHRAFITESRRAATRRQRVTVGISVVFVVLALGLAGIAYWQREVAIANEQIAGEERDHAISALRTQSRLITDAAQEQMDASMYVEAMLLALEVLPDQRAPDPIRRKWPETPEAKQQLIRGFSGHWSLAAFHHPPKSTKCARFGPRGERIVSCSYSGVAIVWDVRTGSELLRLRGHTDNVEDATFSLDGSVIATGSRDGTVRLWNANDGQETRRIEINPEKKIP